MVDQIRFNALPHDSAPLTSDVAPIDGATTRKTTIVELVNAARPFASQAEAEAGTSTTKGMNPLTTAQAVAALGGAAFAPITKGVPTGGATNQVLGKTSNADNAVSWRNAGAGDVLSVNNLSDLANLGTARTNLGLVIGTNVQAWDADLDAISAISTQPYGRSLLALSSQTALSGELSTFYQPLASGLTSWAALTRASGFDAFTVAPSSANLLALLTTKTGSGSVVFNTSPTLVTPVLGAATGTSLQLSGLTASSAVATDASKNLVSVTNTGTGNNVLATSPTITTPTIAGTSGSQATLTAGLNDSSSVAANGAKMWNPLYYTNPGTAVVHRFNRVLVGEATINSSDIGPVTTKDWMETLLASTVAAAQFASVAATGQLGVSGGSRTSDFRTIFASASGGSQGVTGIGYNDDTTAATTPIACGVVGIAIHKVGCVGITLNQFDINSTGAVVDATPFGGVASGSTWAVGLTPGAYSALATQNATGAMYIGQGTTTKFRKGIIVFNGALDTTLGQGGGGVAFELYRGMSTRWLNSGSTVDAEIWGDAGGFKFATAGGVQLNVSNVASAVNFLQLFGSATGGEVEIAVGGSDTNVPLGINAKGSGGIFFRSRSLNILDMSSVASAVNRLSVVNSATGAGPILSTSGTDANISGKLQGTGTGGWQFLDGGAAKKFEYNTTGIGFFNATPAAQGAIALPTGTIQRTTYATSTVTLAQLAGVVMAMITDMRAYGLSA